MTQLFIEERSQMDQILNFLVNHWILCSLFIIILLAIIRVESVGTVHGVKLINPQEVVQLINHQGGVIIDIRSEQTYTKGHILGSIFMTQQQINDQIKKLEKYKKKPIIMVCQMGQQSPKVGAILIKSGFEQVYGLRGGIQAWQAAELPVSKS